MAGVDQWAREAARQQEITLFVGYSADRRRHLGAGTVTLYPSAPGPTTAFLLAASCTIKLLKTVKHAAGFYDFDEYERLVEAARTDSPAYLVALLGGDAGLRCGEMMALEWTDIDLSKRQLCVARSDWKGHVTAAKGRRLRYVPLTRRLTDALRQARHLRGARVLCDATGQPLTQKIIQVKMRKAARRANVKAGVHILRHTFCSHLAMRGAPARAIQELAGHQDLQTTQRYMHLSPAALDAAIRLLEEPAGPDSWQVRLGPGATATAVAVEK